jgi:hypothetical protein
MTSTKSVVIVVVAVATAFGILVTPFLVIPLIPVVAVLALAARRHDHSIGDEAVRWSHRWYLWVAAAAIAFVVGSAMLVTADDGDLSTAAWATFLVSWLTAAISATIGVGLGVTHFVNHRRSQPAITQ